RCVSANEEHRGLASETLAHLCPADEAGDLRRKHPLSAPLWPGNQISVRQPILFMGPPQISQRRSARKSHLRFSILPVKQVSGNAKKLFPKFPSRSCPRRASRRSGQCDLVRERPVPGTLRELAHKTRMVVVPFDPFY